MNDSCRIRIRLVASALGLAMMLLAMSGAAPAQSQQTAWAEASVENTSPYVEQSIIYTVRVFSVSALKRIAITPPQTPGMVIEELDGPAASYRTRNGTRYIVNEYRYALTPITPGPLEIGATELRITPAVASQWGAPQTPYNPWSLQPRNEPHEIDVASQPTSIEVLPPRADVQPWLPLEALRLETRWSPHDGVRRGEPLQLTIVMTARGARGNRLPSLAPLLVSEDFKAYPERHPETDWQFTPDGGSLLGRRIETYTVVPTRDGRLRMPPISVPWWNVGFDRRSVTALPTGGLDRATRVAASSGSEPPGSLGSDLASRETLIFFVLPITGALLIAFLFGWWIGTGNSERRSLMRVVSDGARRMGTGLGNTFARAAQRGRELMPATTTRRLDDFGQRLKPSAALEPTVGAVLSHMPLRAKVWWCTRCVGKEREPAKMCEFVRKFACAHLKMSPNAPLRSIGEGIARERPGPEANALRRLLADLDSAVYGNLRLDIAHWQRNFRHKFLKAYSRRRPAEPTDLPERGLPKLNP